MFVFLTRVFGLWLVGAAVVGVVIDGTKSIAADKLVVTALGETWFTLSPSSLNQLQALVERNIHPILWDPVIQWILMLPNWAVIGALGFLLVWLTGPKSNTGERMVA